MCVEVRGTVAAPSRGDGGQVPRFRGCGLGRRRSRAEGRGGLTGRDGWETKPLRKCPVVADEDAGQPSKGQRCC